MTAVDLEGHQLRRLEPSAKIINNLPEGWGWGVEVRAIHTGQEII